MKATERRSAKKIIHAKRGEASALARSLGVSITTISHFWKGRTVSGRIEAAVRQRVAELTAANADVNISA